MAVAQTLAAMPSSSAGDDQRYRRRMAEALMLQSLSNEPIRHWTQGASKVAQSLAAGYMNAEADREDKAKELDIVARLTNNAPGLNQSASLPTASMQPSSAPAPTPQMAAPMSAPTKPQSLMQPAPGSPNSVVAQAFSDTQAAIDAGVMDPQGRNNIPPSSSPMQPTPVQTVAFRPQPATAAPPAATPADSIPQIDPATAQYIKSLMANKATRGYGMQLYNALVTKNMQQTNDQREYDQAVRQGFKGSILDYQLKLKEAGKPITNINQQQESEFNKAAGKLQAERFNDLVKSGYDAQGMVADLNFLREIGSRVTTGKTAEITAALGPYAEMLGISIDKLSDLQAYKSISAKMAPRVRPPGSGATSDFEMRQYMESLPTLGKTPEGNEIIANTQQALLEHRQAAAEIGSLVLAGEISAREGEKRLRELPDPLALWKKNKGASPAASPGVVRWEKGPDGRVPTPEEAAAELRRRGKQ